MIRKAAIRTSTEGGDGTATTTVLTKAFVDASFNEIKDDSSKIREVYERLQKGKEDTLKYLSSIKQEIKEEDIEKIANISSLDPEISKIIADMIKEVGKNGVIQVERSPNIGYSYEVVKGAKFDQGLLSQYFINDFDKEQCILENPYIWLVDRKVSLSTQIKKVCDEIEKTGNKSLLIIADDVDGLALASLAQNSKSVRTMRPDGSIMQGTWDIACVKNPFNASRGKDFLLDMASLTGGTVISEEAGFKLDDTSISQLGRADKVIVTKDTCTIIGGKGSNIQERINLLESKIDSTMSEYEKALLKDRLASLTGGIGVIHVGTYTDQEFNTKKQKFDNAINSTQSALQEGILPGGGIALLEASVDAIDPMFKQALCLPFNQQCINAGVLETPLFSEGQGINFKTKETVNMIKAGIIDPFKVVRLALESAIALASTLATNEVFITKENEKCNTQS